VLQRYFLRKRFIWSVTIFQDHHHFPGPGRERNVSVTANEGTEFSCVLKKIIIRAVAEHNRRGNLKSSDFCLTCSAMRSQDLLGLGIAKFC
jgi:hypothetical protein